MFKAKRVKLNSLGPEMKLSIGRKNKKKNGSNQTKLLGFDDFLSENSQKVVFRLDPKNVKIRFPV